MSFKRPSQLPGGLENDTLVSKRTKTGKVVRRKVTEIKRPQASGACEKKMAGSTAGPSTSRVAPEVPSVQGMEDVVYNAEEQVTWQYEPPERNYKAGVSPNRHIFHSLS